MDIMTLFITELMELLEERVQTNILIAGCDVCIIKLNLTFFVS